MNYSGEATVGVIRQLIILKSLSFFSILLLVLAGCVAEAPVKEQSIVEEEETAALFYPPLPNPPRIQYLVTFSSSRDVASEDDEASGFARFILGEELDRDVEGVRKPYGVAMYEDKIYVADTRGGGYAIFDVANNKYSFVRGFGASTMPKPINITIDSDGTKYITDTSRNQVLVFDKNDNYQQAFGSEGQFKPVDVAIAENRLYVADIENHIIQVLDKTTGQQIATIGKVGSGKGELYSPTNLAIGPDNQLHVSDTGNFRIQTFTLDGEFVKSVGQVGDTPGSFSRPKGITLDREGRLYVVDAAFENVQIFNKDDELLLAFGGPAAHPSGMNLPTDINISYSSAPYFQPYADPGFRLEYIILVANQFGYSKVNVFGFGRMDGMSYLEE